MDVSKTQLYRQCDEERSNPRYSLTFGTFLNRKLRDSNQVSTESFTSVCLRSSLNPLFVKPDLLYTSSNFRGLLFTSKG